MYAWRARIGLIKPTHRGKSFAFWYKHAPDGVELVPTSGSATLQPKTLSC